MGALNSIRVIDFGHYVAGPLTGMLLADQGAEVIKVDPPEGPVFESAANATWNRGKTGIALDLRSAEDVAIARELITGADVVIENFRPGTMAAFGLRDSDLMAENPRLIYNAMPGFSPQDDRAGMPAWEGVVMAAADVFRPIAEYRNMVQVLHQEPSRRAGTPVFTSEPIASCYAAILSALSVSAALYARTASGKGQRVEVPLFDALLQGIGIFAMSSLPFTPITTSVFSGLDHQYQCSDGRWFHVVCTVSRHGEIFLRDLGRDDMVERGMTSRSVGSDLELNRELTKFLTTTFATRTAAEWEEHFQSLSIPGAPCLSSEDWLQHPQAIESDLFTTVDDPHLGQMRQPGLQVKLSATPGGVRGPAPLPDQHRAAILDSARRPAAALPEPIGTNSGLPLDGIRVLDLCIILAGPTCGRTLAELGADVIKIDDPNRGPIVYHHDINRGKRSVLLDLATPDGLEVFWQLVERSDVIVQNYRSDVVERLGIDDAAVRQRKPDIIYASLNAYGDTGPMAHLPGYEESTQALTGMQVRFGGADKPILWPFGVVNDYGTGYAGAFGVLMALLARKEHGIGQEVISALARTAGTLQSAHLQDYDGKVWDEPTGPNTLGHGSAQRLYECTDGWIFVGARSEGAIAEQTGIASGQGFEEGMIRWCGERRCDQAIDQLSSPQIGAQESRWLNDVASSPEVLERGVIVAREHGSLGLLRTTGPGPWFSESSIRPGRPAPPPGADAASVLDDIGRADLDQLIQLGVIHVP